VYSSSKIKIANGRKSCRIKLFRIIICIPAIIRKNIVMSMYTYFFTKNNIPPVSNRIEIKYYSSYSKNISFPSIMGSINFKSSGKVLGLIEPFILKGTEYHFFLFKSALNISKP